MKKIKSIAVFLVIAIAMLTFVGCKEEGIKNYSQNINTYDIVATFNESDMTVSASQTVTYVNKYDVELNELNFHMYPNAYREGARFSPIPNSDMDLAYPEGMSYGKMDISSVKIGANSIDFTIGGQDEDILIIPLKDMLMPSNKVQVEIEFKVTLPKVRHRLGYNNNTVNLGNWYPIASIYEKGQFNNDPYYSNGDPFYSQLANYNVTLNTPEGYKVASTGAKTKESDSVKHIYQARAVRDFAMVLSKKFETASVKVGKTDITYFYYNDSSAEQSLQAAADSIKTFNELYGEYPYETYSVVQTAFLQGGMEYPNLVYISDAVIGEIYKEVIVHETAHQWWYGVVGNNQVAHAWMDEGLAEYSTTVFYDKNPQYNVQLTKRISDTIGGYILYCDIYKTKGSDTSMNRKVSDYANTLEYTYMTYVKGQLMFDSLKNTIGETNFFNSLKKYYKDSYMTTATPDNLIASFEKTCNQDLLSFFNSWLEGKVEMGGGF